MLKSKVIIVNPSLDNIFLSFGISEKRSDEFTDHLTVVYNQWNKNKAKDYSELLAEACYEFTGSANKAALISFQLGQIVCKIQRIEKRMHVNPWNDFFFKEIGVSEGREDELIKHMGEASRNWGAGIEDSYSVLIEKCCSICESIIEIGVMSYVLEAVFHG